MYLILGLSGTDTPLASLVLADGLGSDDSNGASQSLATGLYNQSQLKQLRKKVMTFQEEPSLLTGVILPDS